MADEYGATEAGFIRPTFQEIREEFVTGMRGEVGPNVVPVGGKLSREFDVVANMADKIWQAVEGVYRSRTPKGATGIPLDDLCAITGTFREGPKKSSTTLRVTGTPGAAVAVGFTAGTNSGTRFKSTKAGVIAAVPAWAPSTDYDVGDLVTKNSAVYVVENEGHSAASGGPSGTGTAIVDGGVIWSFVGSGTGVADVPALAEEYGPLAANAGTITQVVTPLTGISSVINPEDAAPGTDREDDASLRIRREGEIRGSGAAAPDAIRSKVLRVGDGTLNPVVACSVFENTTYLTNSDGMPPHSIEVLVQGGEDAEVALAIWRSKPGGIYTHGTIAVVVKDSAGDDQAVRFSRAVEVPIYVAMTIEKGPEWPTLPDDETLLLQRIREAVTSYNDQLSLGERVVRNFIIGFARVADDTVIADVPLLYVGTAPSPTGTVNISISTRNRAKLDTSRITITLV